MTDDSAHDRLFGAPIDPIALARRDLQKALPRRFWKEVAIHAREGGYAIVLDGRPARTPGKSALVVPTRALADLLAAEWRAQDKHLDPQTMPLTRLVNTSIDAVSHSMEATRAETAKFAETDLVCYRAQGPETLVAAQALAWDPILAFARDALDARFLCTTGITYVAQPEAARRAVVRAIDKIAAGAAGPLRLTAVSLMTNLMGSVLLALAVAHEKITAADAWSAAHVDEDIQMRIWGYDADASARRAMRGMDMRAAACAFALAV